MRSQNRQDVEEWVKNGNRLVKCPPDPRIAIGCEIMELNRLYTQATMTYNIGDGCHHFTKSGGSE